MGGAATHPQQLNPSRTQISSPRRGRSRSRYTYFRKGDAVEVRTNDEGFKGVYFTASVLRSTRLSPKNGIRKRSRLVYVVYDNLLAREDGLERLREHVELSSLRPAPPRIQVVKPFETDDVVDAFYKDGWWPGVVTRVVEGGQRYIVTFSCPPDELEFGFSDLRVHCDWINGIWVHPQKQRIAGLMYCVGRKVEVSFDRENCQDAWFPGTIHEDLGNGAFLVEYRSATEPVKVTINYPHIRPCPPLLKNRNFDLLEKVDAFFDFGWWSGVVTKVHENGRYTVFFKQMKRDKDFSQSELRPHMEWKDGKWFTSSQVTLSSIGKDHSEQVIPDNQKMSHLAACLTKSRQHESISQNALSQPTEKEEGNVVGAQEQYTLSRSSKDTICSSVSPISVTKKSISASQTVTRELHTNNTSWGKRIRRNQRNIDVSQNASDKVNNCIPSSVNGSSVQMLELENPTLNVEEKGPDAVGNVADVQNEHAEKEAELHVIIGLPCAETGSSEYATKGKRGRLSNRKEIMNLASDRKRQLIDLMAQKVKDDKKLEIEETPERRKRGRPKKIPLEGILSPVTGKAKDGVVCSGDLSGKSEGSCKIPEAEVMEMEASLPNPEMALNNDKSSAGCSEPKNENGNKRKRIPSKMHSEKAVEESVGLQGTRSSRRGRKLTGGLALQVTDSVVGSGVEMKEVNEAVEIDKEVCQAPDKDFDNEPLSKWMEGIQSPPSIDGARSTPACVENGKRKGDSVLLIEDGEKHPESGRSTNLVATGSFVPSEPENLPFMKNTFLWDTIESMEVFQRMPQKPHFKPLENFSASSREGLAIGYMVTFSSVVERTRRLQLDDPESVTDDVMETLADLEQHGFDVKAVQDCITERLEVRKKWDKKIADVKMLKEQILEREQERSRMEEEIKDLQEKISLVESAKESVAGKIESAQAELKVSEENLKKVDTEFQDIASSLLWRA